MLEIRVLGGLEVVQDGVPAPLPPSRKTRALLAYLALTGGRHRREQLCETFWDVPDDPRGCSRPDRVRSCIHRWSGQPSRQA